MIQTFLLTSLPPPGEGGMGLTGQARAPDGWDSEFASALLNFLFEQDGENQESLVGAAGVIPPGLLLSMDAAFPVIETPGDPMAPVTIAETGNTPVAAPADGTGAVFAPPAESGSTVAAGAQIPADAAVEAAAGGAIEQPGSAAPSTDAGQLHEGAATAVEGVTSADQAAKAQPVQSPAPEPMDGAQFMTESQPGTAAEGQMTAGETGNVGRSVSDPWEGRSRAPAGESENRPTPAVEPAAAEEVVTKVEFEKNDREISPSQPETEALLFAVGEREAQAAVTPKEVAAGPTRPIEQAAPVSTQPLQSPSETHIATQRVFSPVEGNDQGEIIHIVRTIQTSVQHGQSSLRLQLNPQELGSIDVRLVSNPQGVGVTVFADQASTGRLLEMQIDQLRVALQDAGVQISHLNVFQHSQQRHEAPADWNRRMYNRRQPAFARQDQSTTEAVEGLWLGQSVVDYRV